MYAHSHKCFCNVRHCKCSVVYVVVTFTVAFGNELDLKPFMKLLTKICVSQNYIVLSLSVLLHVYELTMRHCVSLIQES